MVRALRVALLLALLGGALPYPIAAAGPLDVSFTVVRETPVSVTIRATISGATAPLQVTARVDDYHATAAPTVRGITLAQVEREARYQHTPETETVLVPIDEKIATLTAKVDSLEKAPIAKGEDTTLREEEIDVKETDLTALYEAKDLGATHVPQEVVKSHTYTLEYREHRRVMGVSQEGDTLVLPTQTWADPPPGKLTSTTELDLKPTTVNWNGNMVYEYTIDTGDARTADGGYGSAGILVLTINGRDYYDDTHSSWWDNAWPYRMKLTIDNSASTENLIDFPLMVKLTPERFDYSFAQVDGDDIRFVDSDGTALDYECDTWELDGDSWFWVRVPQIDALSTTDYIWMYWGTAAVGNGENAEGVWNDGYVAVYHMNDNPTDSTQILDSTANANTGTKGNDAAAPTEVAGTVGMAQEFVQLNLTQITIGDSGLNAASTVLALLKTTTADAQVIVGKKRYPTGASAGWCLSLNADGTTGGRPWYTVADDVDAASATGATSIGTTAWRTVAGTHDAALVAVYLDGAIANSADASAVDDLTTAYVTYIGRRGYSVGTLFDGLIDEFRLSSVARSAEWIEAEYLTMWDSMLTYGDAEDMPEETEDVPVVAVATSLLVVAVALAAVKQKHIILYLASFILLLFLGFDTFDASLPLAVMVFMFAGFMLYSMSTWFWRHA